MFRLATELVCHTSRNIFLTGKAGTGKTTFLKYIREHCPKQMLVVAPTGVAAINAGGVTIHSLFQIPIHPFIPSATGYAGSGEIADPHSLLSRLRMTHEKQKLLRELELLIIDEISMVRCDMLDAVDTVLRHVRNERAKPFGGVQVLLIGDMFQLPPVTREEDWKILRPFYQSPYFFDSHAFLQEKPLHVEFNRIYRQTDPQFINLLNEVRNNRLSEEGLQLLESRYSPHFRRTRDDGYIILTSHNESARFTNSSRLRELETPLFEFAAAIEDDFPPNAYPAEEILQLKEGAQVMFIKNDTDKAKRFFNGKLGKITRLEESRIFVRCEGDDQDIEVPKMTWENIRYNLNKATRSLETNVLGSFSQFPLRLAWAITIHKSQGLTFEKAIIDAGHSFAAGQVYVALSRCTSLEGMVLQSRINSGILMNDARIVTFSENNDSADNLETKLAFAKAEYLRELLLSLFDFAPDLLNATDLKNYVVEHQSSFNKGMETWVDSMLGQMRTINEVGSKFQRQLRQLFEEADEHKLWERMQAASRHFSSAFLALSDTIQNSPAITDSHTRAREYDERLKEILERISLKQHFMSLAAKPFTAGDWHRHRLDFKVPRLAPKSYVVNNQEHVEELAHPELYQQLKKQRDAICLRKDIPVYLVANSNTLRELATYLPQNLSELSMIHGLGPSRIHSYGQQFLDTILSYTAGKGLESQIHQKKISGAWGKSRPPKESNTKKASYDLFREGLTPARIAEQRNLAVQTIENHLAHFISKGNIDILELLTREKLEMIQPLLLENPGLGATAIKARLGDKVTYGEIRLAMAWCNRENK